MRKPARSRAASVASSLVEYAPYGMLRIAADGAFLEANPAIALLLGYERAADLLALNLAGDVLADPGDLPRLRAAFDADPPEPFQTSWRRRDRSLLIVRIVGRRVARARGAVAYDCWTGDLGAHADADARFRALVEHTFDLITLFAPDGRVLWSSPGAVRVLGYEPQETVGGNLAQFVHPDDRNAAMRVFAALTAEPGRSSRVVFRGVHKDGSVRHIEAVGVNRLDHPAIRAVVVTFWDVTERVRMEEMLRQSETYYRAVLEQAGDAIFVLAADGNVILANRRACEMFGYTAAEILGVGVRETYVPEERDQIRDRLERLRRGETLQYERQALKKDGSSFPVEITARMLDDGKIQSIIRDISGRRRLEEQLRQSSKMEAVGQLAGGVAHDFNNLLTAILGGCGFLLDDSGLAAENRRDVEEIQNAARRAAALTKQLLAFSRKQVLQPEDLPLNAVITGVAPLLRRLIGEHVTVTTVLADGLPDVRADRSQLEQVIINLCVNARDAMPKGGTLTMSTEEVDLDDAYVAAHPDLQAGHFVVLVVADTGVGMDEATRSRAFEPFFTTKGPRFGTGLGLSTVYGIVKQSNGHIAVYSEPGRGTTFRIYLPPAGGAEAGRGAARSNDTGAVRRGTETVLLVEDEQRVRTLARRILEGLGYRVLESADGREALALGQEFTERIDLLFTDVVMPTMSGRELAGRLAHAHPEMRVLYTSGYADSTIVSQGVLNPDVAYLPKPYTADGLGRRVREVLDTSG